MRFPRARRATSDFRRQERRAPGSARRFLRPEVVLVVGLGRRALGRRPPIPAHRTLVALPARRPSRASAREFALLAVVVLVALAAACLAVFGLSVEAVVDILACAVLVAVTVTDLERRIVPNRIIVPALAVALVVQTVRDPSIEWLAAALGAGGFFLVAALIYPAGLGMGDVKLAAFLGAWLGAPVIVALFAGSIFAVVPAIVILATQGSAGRKVGLPFAPFLAAGGIVALFAGDRLLDAWLA